MPTKGKTPAALGYAMPAEWETHEATWLGWPHNPSDWPGKLDTIRWVYGEIVRKISAGETVRMLVNSREAGAEARRYLDRAGADTSGVEFVVHKTNRGWMRDSGPVFVRRQKGRGKTGTGNEIPRRSISCSQEVSGAEFRSQSPFFRPDEVCHGLLETAIVHFHFNAWAKYDDWRLDRKVPEMAAKRLGKPLFDARAGGSEFVLEGGGIDVNGHGTLITTEECYLDPAIQVRNPGLDRAGYEAAFRDWLGVRNIWWLAGGPVGDDTHGHVDDICRFVDRRTIVLVREDNPSDINYRALAQNWERAGDFRLEDGARPEVVALPMPGPLYFEGERLPASYANFYIANAAVIVPTFNDPNDRVALGILGELFRDRPVVGIHAVDLVLGFGTLHCLTQQQPAASA